MDAHPMPSSTPGVMKVIVSAQQRFHYFELAGQLARQGHLQRLYTGYPASRVYEVESSLVRSHWLPTTAYLLLERRGLHALSRRLNAPAMDGYGRWVARHLEPSDVVVAGSSWAPDVLRAARRPGSLAICDRGSTHIITQRDIMAEEYGRFGVPFGFKGNPMDGRIIENELEAYEEADYITVPSTFALSSFVAQGIPAHKLIRIPYGVDLSDYRPLAKRDTIFRVLFVGSASLRKGIQYLLEATAGLRLPDFEVVLVGGIADDARAIVERHAGRVRLLGVVPRLELADVYSQGSVLVLPSVEDGFGLVQAQAMACGLPVIATTATGAHDLFTPGVEGLIVPIRDVTALREAILQLYEQPELRTAMGQNALARVRAMGGWAAYGNHAVAAYQQALAAQRRSRTNGTEYPHGCRSPGLG